MIRALCNKRLREIQALNERAIGLHQLNIDTIRNNYGAGPLDTSDRVNPKPAIGAGQPAPKAKPSVVTGNATQYHCHV